jgi:hypothetical protein
MSKRVRRRLFIALGLLACVLLTSGVAWLLWPQTAITQENAAKLRKGMTLAEVEAMLGGPARDDSTGPLEMAGGGWPAVGAYASINSATPGDPHYQVWKSDRRLVGVRLDDSGRVSHKG